MNEFDALLARAVEQARALGIPVSARISPRVAVNRRAVTRFGCCIRRGGEYVIELSERLLEAEERACMQTLAAGGSPGAVPLPVRWRVASQQLNLSGEGVPNGKEK